MDGGMAPTCCTNETRLALLGDPGISALEREHRARILEKLDEKVARDGVYDCSRYPDKDGAVQFLPYKSLKGWDGLVQDEMHKAEHAGDEEREPWQEDLWGCEEWRS